MELRFKKINKLTINKLKIVWMQFLILVYIHVKHR